MSNSRKYIAPQALGLPDNFVVLEGASWADALKTFDRELKKAPQNLGNFRDTSFTPSPELETLLDRLLETGALEVDTYGMANTQQMDRALRMIFNDIAGAGALSRKEKDILKEFAAHLRDIVEPLLDTWPGETNVSLQLRCETTGRSLHSHFDPGRGGNSLVWRKDPFYGVSFNVLASFNTVSTAFHDRRDIVSTSDDEYNKTGLRRYDINKITFRSRDGDEWHARPWTLSVVTPNIWTHTPVANSAPRSLDPQKPEKRFMAHINVSKTGSPFAL